MSLEELERQAADCNQRLRSPRATPILEEYFDEKGGTAADDRLVGLLTRRELLRENHKYVRAWVAAVEKGLAALSERERRVLVAFYIERYEGYLERLCGELAMEKSAVYKLKDTALRRFTLARYGITEG